MIKLLTRLLGAFVVFVFPSLVFAQTSNLSGVDVTAEFTPSRIIPGAESYLVITFDHFDSVTPVDGIGLMAAMPTAVTVGENPVLNGCGGAEVVAPVGGTGFGIGGLKLGVGESCSISIAATATLEAEYTFTGSWSSDLGLGGSMDATLTVAAAALGVTKSLSLYTMDLGGVTRVTYDLTSSSSNLRFNFSETLPSGLEIASPANAFNTCYRSLSAVPGGSSISLQQGFTDSTAVCQISFDVKSSASGSFPLAGSFDVTSPFPGANVGDVVKTLTVNPLPDVPVTLQKSFGLSQASAGDTVPLTFTLTNTSRAASATAITFSDDLDAMLSGTIRGDVPAALCGTGSSLGADPSNITLTGGTLAPGASCSFTVDTIIPANVATTSNYVNVTGAVTGLQDGQPFTGNQATASLRVLTNGALPVVLTKSFDGDNTTPAVQDPAFPGDSVFVTYELTNPNTSEAATEVAFVDAIVPSGMTPVFPNTVDNCGSSGLTFTAFSGEFTEVVVPGASVGAGASCTITVEFTVPASQAPGSYPTTTGEVSAVVAGTPVARPGASATLVIEGGANLTLSKSFKDTIVAAGDQAEVTFTVKSAPESVSEAVNLSFSDDLDAFITGATFGGGFSSGCGATFDATDPGLATVNIPSLAPGASCEVTFAIDIPAGANSTFTNTTSQLTATAGGVATLAAPASADLKVVPTTPLTTTKTFTPATAIPGQTVSVSYTLENTSALDYTGVQFTENFNSTISGATATGITTSGSCGTAPTISMLTSNFLFAASIDVLAGQTCVISLDLTVPTSASDNTYSFTSSAVSATVAGGSVALPAMNALLDVNDDVLTLAKTYSKAVVGPGETFSVEYVLSNALDELVSDVSFTEFAANLPLGTVPSLTGNTCGAITLTPFPTGLTAVVPALAASSSCRATFNLAVPAVVTPGVYAGSTSDVTGTIAGPLTVSGAAANAQVEVLGFTPPQFSAQLSASAVGPGTEAGLVYTLTNPNASFVLDDLDFSVDLSGAIAGSTIVPGSLTSTCTGVSLGGAGTGVLAVQGAVIAASGQCTISLQLAIPSGTTAGNYDLQSSALTSNGQQRAAATSVTLAVEPPPTLAAVFAPDSLVQGAVTTLTYTIDNSAASLSTTGLGLATTLTGGLEVANPSNASTTCTGGTITAASGSTAFSYAGGTVAAGASCTVSFDVLALQVGNVTVTSGDLTSSLGNSGSASDVLAVSAAPVPGLAKSFALPSVSHDGATTMTFDIDNTGALIPAQALDFTDNLPAGMVVATPANVTNTCTGGTLSAVAGGGIVSYTGGTVAASQSCAITVDVALTAPGSVTNTTGDLTSSLGNSGTGSATLSMPSVTISTPIAGDNIITLADLGPVPLTGSTTQVDDGGKVEITITEVGAGTTTYEVSVSGGTWSLPVDLAGGADETVLIEAQATDTHGSTSAVQSVTVIRDLTAPSGHSVSFDVPFVNAANQASVGFTLVDAEVNAAYAYTITSAGGGTALAGSGTIASATEPFSGLDLSGLGGGELTVSVVLTDPLGNPAAAVTATVEKDTVAPTFTIDSPIAGDDLVNAAEVSTTTFTGSANGMPDGSYVLLDWSGNGMTIEYDAQIFGGVWSRQFDVGFFSDGQMSLRAYGEDAAGNPATPVIAYFVKDVTAATGYSAAFDQGSVNAANQTAVSFTFADAEVGASFDYTISNTAVVGATVTGTGIIATTDMQVPGLDLSGLADGELTLSVALTDPAGNAGVAVTDTVTKDTVVPFVMLTAPTDAQSDPFEVTATFSEDVTGLTLAGIDIDNGTASDLLGSGDTYTFTLTPDHDGDVTITVLAAAAQDGQGNDSTASDAVVVLADLTGTPNPTPLPDADGDGIPDAYESGSADRDNDGIPDNQDYDPQGYFYCEDDGRILPGGSITVSGPSGSNSSVGLVNDINIVTNGASGSFQWFATRPGTYTVSYSYPTNVGLPSTTRLSAGALDMTSILPANPGVLGSTEVGSTGLLADASLAANPVFYSTFVIEAGDPHVLANNIPMTLCAENPVSISAPTNGAEANGGTPTDVGFVITQDRLSALPTVVSFTMGGTASGGVDYVAPSGTATIAVGDLSVAVDLTVIEDGLIEGLETLSMTLTSVTGGDTATILSTTSADLSATATIVDDDSAVIAVTDLDLTASESGNDDGAMRFVLLGQPTADVVLSFAGDTQCSVAPATLTFTAGNYSTPQVLTIKARNDDKVEGAHSCQPTVSVASGDAGFDGFALALSPVQITDDLVDQIRDPLTEILKNDLEQTVRTQQRGFSRIAKGALDRLHAGQDDLACGTINAPDVDGGLTVQDGTATSDGKFGWDVYNCYTMRREILDGSFSLNWSADTGTQAILQFARQSEKFTSDKALRGHFWGGYFSRNSVDGLAEGEINGYGLNGGVYGAQNMGTGLFLDYYASAAVGVHNFDLTFDAAPADIDATGSYRYAALFGGVALSGTREYQNFSVSPRVGLDLAHAWVSDADVTARQLGQTDTGTIDLPNFSGSRFYAEIEFAGLGSQKGAAELGQMLTETTFTPRVACEFSSYDSGADCSAGINLAVLVTQPTRNLSYGFEIDYERMSAINRLTLDFTRERRFARDQGAVVTRLSMPGPDSVTVEHGVKLDW